MLGLIFFVSLAISWLLVGGVRRLAVRVGVLDVPNERSSHLVPTPRGGGIVIVLMTIAAAMLNAKSSGGFGTSVLTWFLGGGLIAAIGFIDDRRGLDARVRLFAQFVSAAILLVAFGGPPDVPVGAGTVSLGAGGWLIAVPAVVWSVNLFNFMDGVDGLAASQAIFVFGGAIAVAHGGGMQGQTLPFLVLAAASAGFLVWNYAPAKIFMGDVGSGFLGYAVAVGALATSGTGAVTVWTWLVLDAAFIADATTTLAARLVSGRQLFQAHRLHAYQRLARRFGSHRAVTALYAAINLLWCLPWAIATTRWPGAGWALTAAALAPLLLAAAGLGAGTEE